MTYSVMMTVYIVCECVAVHCLLIHSDQVDHIVIGTVIQEVKTSNIAREVPMNENYPPMKVSYAPLCLSLMYSLQ